MRYVLLFTPRLLTLADLISRAPEMEWIHASRDEPGTDTFSGMANGERIWLEQGGGPNLERDWADEPENLARIRALGPERDAYFVHFRDAYQLEATLCRIADDPDFLIDDDHGLFVRGDAFAELARTASDDKWLLEGHYRRPRFRRSSPGPDSLL